MSKTITLRKMCLDEFPAYCEYFIDDYSKEIVENYGHSLEFAIGLAKKELERNFPNGLETNCLEDNGHDLLCIEYKNNTVLSVVGYLWHAKNETECSTFIYDFYVSNEFRGKGFGKQAISELENQLKAESITQIKLRVAYHNKRALKLYKEAGFSITGYNMAKNIG